MDQLAGEECGICLDALKNPVALPCSHRFCSECLNGWRSKFGAKSGDKETNTKCPLCREKIPPSREMVAQLKFYQTAKSNYEVKGDIYSEEYMSIKSAVERLEHEIGDWTETIDYSTEDKDCVVLPEDICEAARKNNIQKVLNWLRPLPVDKHRLNAKNPEMADFTLVFAAAANKNSELLSILLQYGADVDPFAADGVTPFYGAASRPDYYAQARLLLEWGADISNCPITSKDQFVQHVIRNNNHKLANLLKSEFGGRRCEIINLSKRPDLNGSTCVVEQYLPDKGRYKVTFEASKEAGLVSPQNLKRRDRTPDDCGYYISYKNGRTTRHEFASKEEGQAFVASLTEGDKSGDVDAEAEARAERAAASLLAELSIDSSECVKSKKKGKKKGKKNRRK